MIRLTQSQIENEIQRLKAQGVDESFINRRLQQDISSGKISVSAEPKNDIIRNVAGAIVKPAVDFAKYVGEAGYSASRLSDPLYRSAVAKSNAGQELSPEEAEAVLSKPSTQFLPESKLANRGEILSTGAKATAGAASYAVPFGTAGKTVAGVAKPFVSYGVKGLAGAGALSGALQAYSQDENITTGAGLGAVGGVVLGKVLPKVLGMGKNAITPAEREVADNIALQAGTTVEKLAEQANIPVEKYVKMSVPEQMFNSNFTIPRAMSKWVDKRNTIRTMLEYKNVGSMEDIGNFANHISGESGFITKLQRKVISQSGKDIQTGNVFDGVKKALNEVIDITPAQQKQVMSNLQNTLPIGDNIGTANALDVFDAITKLEKKGFQLLKQGANKISGNIRDEELGDIYLNVANNLKDSLEVGARNQLAVKNIITPEVLANARKISPKLAEQLSKAKTIRDLRGIQAPFVRIQKMIDVTLEGESSVFNKYAKGQSGKLPLVGGAIELGTNALGGKANISTRAAAMGEGKAGQVAGKIVKAPVNLVKGAINMAKAPASPIGARIGAIGGAAMGGQMSETPGQATTPTQEQSAIPSTPGAVDIFGGHSKQEVLNAALQSGAKLKDLKEISDTFDLLSEVSGGEDTKLTANQKTKLGSLSTASGIIDTVEKAFSTLNSPGFGTIARLLGMGKNLAGIAGLDVNASTYKSTKEGAASLLLKALGEAGTLSDKDIARAGKLLPDLGDSSKEAEIKFQRLRKIIELSKQGVFDSAQYE